MSPVRRAVKGDAPAIAQRVAHQLLDHATFEPLVCANFSRQEFELALAHSCERLWVEDSDGFLRGHLYGVTLESTLAGRQTWTGPDGYSYETSHILDNLCERAYRSWRENGARDHLVWALAGHGTQEWVERGYGVLSVRGSLPLDQSPLVNWPLDQRVRRATPSDLTIAMKFDRLIDAAQGVDVGALSDIQRDATSRDLAESLEDPDSYYFLLEVANEPVAQCVTFTLPALRGSYANTLHVGSLAVADGFQRRGLGAALVRHVLRDAFASGFGYAEARWHIDNQPATSFWSTLGFRPTYVLLRRPLDS